MTIKLKLASDTKRYWIFGPVDENGVLMPKNSGDCLPIYLSKDTFTKAPTQVTITVE